MLTHGAEPHWDRQVQSFLIFRPLKYPSTSHTHSISNTDHLVVAGHYSSARELQPVAECVSQRSASLVRRADPTWRVDAPPVHMLIYTCAYSKVICCASRRRLTANADACFSNTQAWMTHPSS